MMLSTYCGSANTIYLAMTTYYIYKQKNHIHTHKSHQISRFFFPVRAKGPGVENQREQGLYYQVELDLTTD